MHFYENRLIFFPIFYASIDDSAFVARYIVSSPSLSVCIVISKRIELVHYLVQPPFCSCFCCAHVVSIPTDKKYNRFSWQKIYCNRQYKRHGHFNSFRISFLRFMSIICKRLSKPFFRSIPLFVARYLCLYLFLRSSDCCAWLFCLRVWCCLLVLLLRQLICAMAYVQIGSARVAAHERRWNDANLNWLNKLTQKKPWSLLGFIFFRWSPCALV